MSDQMQQPLQATAASQVVQPATSSTPILTHVIIADDETAVVGVTSVDSRLFVLRSPNQQRIQAYDLKTFTLQQTLKVTGLSEWSSDCNGLTACDVNKCLYASDCNTATVHKIQLAVDNKIFKWKVGGGPIGLSVNNACNLLVACCDYNKIQEYDISGSLVREICFDLNDGRLMNPWNVIELTCGRFLVSCRVDGLDDVVEVDVKGQLEISYTSQLQSTTKPNFSYPRHVAVDKNNECIIVADCGNNKVVMLSRSRNGCAREFNVMSVDGGLQSPSCLHFNESQGRLFVGEEAGQRRVLVFDNVFNIVNGAQ